MQPGEPRGNWVNFAIPRVGRVSHPGGPKVTLVHPVGVTRGGLAIFLFFFSFFQAGTCRGLRFFWFLPVGDLVHPVDG